MPENVTPGQIACEAWIESHLAHHACSNMSKWADMKEIDKADWEAAAEAIIMRVDI
jgi:hypothetical protein